MYGISATFFLLSVRTSLWTKLNNVFCKIGYHRAASELERLGYTDAARRCREELKKLSE